MINIVQYVWNIISQKYRFKKNYYMKVHSTIMRIQMDFIWIRIRLTRKNNGRIRPQEQKLDPDPTNAKNTEQD